MCWSNYMVTPIVLKKPLRVYKVGTVSIFGDFISLYRDFRYYESEVMPTVEIDPEFDRFHPAARLLDPVWCYSYFHIHEGYHSYLTEERAKFSKDEMNEIGIFEIPAGATIYVNYKLKEVVSTDIKYLEKLEL